MILLTAAPLILLLLFIVGVFTLLMYFTTYHIKKDAIWIGYCKYPIQELHLYQFDIYKQRFSTRHGYSYRVKITVYQDGALVREHILAPWTNAGVDKLYDKISRDLQPYLNEKSNSNL